ncbi:DNA adenine methylase [Desulfovibrio cuneatus]|uniref:DNA adenine methylase n=1 Tax=Desulfovibrio cuneatus TaxID=159728 RepID=UPI00041AA27E|nr:DNA adenine methylase [Desulfovibrio cuneatus]
METTRPVLRYHGGKWRLAPWIISHFPQHIAYVEPFGGAASVLLRKQRLKTEIWNDLDGELYDLFALLRNKAQSKELVRLLELTPFSRADFTEAFQPTERPMEKARRLIIRSFFGFSSKASLSEKQNGFRCFRYTENSPAVDWAGYPIALQLIVERMRGVVIENEPALEVVRRYDRPGTLFYVDPPYLHSVRNVKQGAYRHEMTDSDHAALAEALGAIQGMAVVSGYDTPLYGELYAGWRKVSTRAYADMNSPRTECLWLSPLAEKNRQNTLLTT